MCPLFLPHTRVFSKEWRDQSRDSYWHLHMGLICLPACPSHSQPPVRLESPQPWEVQGEDTGGEGRHLPTPPGTASSTAGIKFCSCFWCPTHFHLKLYFLHFSLKISAIHLFVNFWKIRRYSQLLPYLKNSGFIILSHHSFLVSWYQTSLLAHPTPKSHDN